MRLLIITQKVDQDDTYLGFFHEWLKAFARHFNHVTVIALECGSYSLPENVTVHSLGKERHASRVQQLMRFWEYAWQDRASYDVVFCHMSPLYVIAGAPIWSTQHKKVALWYSHRHVDAKLKLAVLLSNLVFSTTPEALRIKTSKLRFVGHAIPADLFTPPLQRTQVPQSIVSVARITPIKRQQEIIAAAALLKERGIDTNVFLVGAPAMPSDEAYAKQLHEEAQAKGVADRVNFLGSIPFKRVREAYWQSTLSANMAPAGGMDKAVLESVAAGTLAVVTNPAFASLYRGYEHRLMFKESDPDDLAHKLEALFAATDREEIAKILQKRVRDEYGLDALMVKIRKKLVGDSQDILEV